MGFCGKPNEPTSVSSTSNEMTVKFYSQRSLTTSAGGFLAQVTMSEPAGNLKISVKLALDLQRINYRIQCMNQCRIQGSTALDLF